MERKNEIQVYMTPNGERVTRALTMNIFIYYDNDRMIVSTDDVIKDRDLAEQVGQQYDIQKNRMNGQIVTQNRDRECPKLCPVELSIDIILLARNLGGGDGIF